VRSRRSRASPQAEVFESPAALLAEHPETVGIVKMQRRRRVWLERTVIFRHRRQPARHREDPVGQHQGLLAWPEFVPQELRKVSRVTVFEQRNRLAEQTRRFRKTIMRGFVHEHSIRSRRDCLERDVIGSVARGKVERVLGAEEFSRAPLDFERGRVVAEASPRGRAVNAVLPDSGTRSFDDFGMTGEAEIRRTPK